MTTLLAAAIVAGFMCLTACVLHLVSRFASAVGKPAVTDPAPSLHGVNPCGAGVRVLPFDDWGFRWHE